MRVGDTCPVLFTPVPTKSRTRVPPGSSLYNVPKTLFVDWSPDAGLWQRPIWQLSLRVGLSQKTTSVGSRPMSPFGSASFLWALGPGGPAVVLQLCPVSDPMERSAT